MMKKLLLLIVACAVSASSVGLAESEAKKKRGGSCTDHCTIGGKEVFSITEDDHPEATYQNFCEEVGDWRAGNVHWCEENCLGQGGTYTKVFNRHRAENVKKFLKERKEDCENLSNKMAEGSGCEEHCTIRGPFVENDSNMLGGNKKQQKYFYETWCVPVQAPGSLKWCQKHCTDTKAQEFIKGRLVTCGKLER